MQYVIMLSLDPATTETIERIERGIATVHSLHRPFDGEIGPHVTLAACEDLDVGRATSALASLMAEQPLPPFRVESLGIFLLDTAVVFAAPVVTGDLLALHARVQRALAGLATHHVAPYLPDAWTPHCTLAERVPRALLTEVVRVASGLPLPLIGQYRAAQIVEFPAGRIRREVPLRS